MCMYVVLVRSNPGSKFCGYCVMCNLESACHTLLATWDI